jgi:inosine-uridine nucleoside N-ribohydrolase
MTKEIPQDRWTRFNFQRLLPIAECRLTMTRLSGTNVLSGQSAIFNRPSTIRAALLFLLTICLLAAPAAARLRRKVIVDQDAAGPGGSNLQAIMLLVKSPSVETLGIGVVTGDAWRDEELNHVMRVLEIEGRTDIPVLPGAAFPLVHTREEAALDEEHYGKINYMGAWDPRWWHQPFEVPASSVPEGMPKARPSTEDATHFMIRMVHQYPHQVTIVAVGPMTDLAIAIRIDHEFPSLAQELVFMGGSISPKSSDAEWESDPRHEFNFWFDPEAAHIVLTAHWAKITCIPVDISIKTHFTRAMAAEIAKSGTPLGGYWVKYYIPYIDYMWDELAAAAWIDPGIITRQKEFYMDVDLGRGPDYGDTVTWLEQDKPNLSGVPVHVLLDLNVEKFNQLFVDTMSLPGSRPGLPE